MELITGDGGFDYSVDFNKQEILSSRLIKPEDGHIIYRMRQLAKERNI